MTKALIHNLYSNPMSGEEIEIKSFEIIDSEARRNGFSDRQWNVVRRMIHTTGDFELARFVKFSPEAIDSAVSALRACRPIYADSNMIRSGLSIARLKRVCSDYEPEKVHCYVAAPDVADLARENALPRSLYAVRKAEPILDKGIAVFGNAPVGLMELNRYIIEQGVKPALVIAMPVGFVHVVESKEEIMSLGIPYVAIEGRRGGSPLAVSVVHALCSLAEEAQ